MLSHLNNPSVKGRVWGIYVTTNETQLKKIRTFLESHPVLQDTGKTIHIGCASWYNLDIMCARKSDFGLIFDFNPENKAFMQKTLEIVSSSPTRQDFVEAMKAYLNSLKNKEREVFFHKDQKGNLIDRIFLELNREGSWLQSDESYNFIKKSAVNKQIVSITESITQNDTFSSLRDLLDKEKIFIDTLYLSNICNFMKTDNDKAAYVQSIKSLLHENTILISCPTAADNTILQQSCLVGKDILAEDFDPSTLFTSK